MLDFKTIPCFSWDSFVSCVGLLSQVAPSDLWGIVLFWDVFFVFKPAFLKGEVE